MSLANNLKVFEQILSKEKKDIRETKKEDKKKETWNYKKFVDDERNKVLLRKKKIKKSKKDIREKKI